MNLTAGQRISTRGEDFLITDVLTNKDGSFIIDSEGIRVIIYEPILNDESFAGFKVFNNFQSFIKHSEIILANRMSEELSFISHKVFTRDIFNVD